METLEAKNLTEFRDGSYPMLCRIKKNKLHLIKKQTS